MALTYTPRARQQQLAPAQPDAAPAGYAPRAPDPNGGFNRYGHSANFMASVASNNAATRATADAFAAGATAPVPVMTQAPTSGTPYANQNATYNEPKLGMAKIGDQVRYFPQMQDSTQTMQARKDAYAAGHNAGGYAYGASIANTEAHRQAAVDAADPAGALMRAKAGEATGHAAEYFANADTKRLIAPHTAANLDSQAGEHQANGTYKLGMLPVDQAKGQADIALKGTQGALNTANTQYRIGMLPIDQEKGIAQAAGYRASATRNTVEANLAPDRAAAQNQRDIGAAHHSEALAINPHITNPGHEYTAQRQHIDDQITQLRTQIANNPASPDIMQWRKTIDQLAAQRTRISGQHFDAAVQTPAGGTPVAPVAAAPAAGPMRIASDADFHSLPSGAEFIAPDGTRRRKP